MVFSSQIFLYYFLPVALLAYFLAPRGSKLLCLVAVSCIFYGWSHAWFVLLIFWSSIVDFVCGNFIGGHWNLPWLRRATAGARFDIPPPSPEVPGEATRGEKRDRPGDVEQFESSPRAPSSQRKLFLGISLANNLGMLFIFKYSGLAQETINHFLRAAGGPGFDPIAVLLPAGISFYTFESISYVVDIYLGRATPASELGHLSRWSSVGGRASSPAAACGGPAGEDARPPAGQTNLKSALTVRRHGRGWLSELRAFNAFACYLIQFPHLVAGPIIRFQDLESQLHKPRLNADEFARGVFFFALGLAKKVLLADVLGDAARLVFANLERAPHEAWFGMFAYAFQIYFDFSGYTDMAIGLGLMFGFQFAKNFDSPYKAIGIGDFWRRWHISLSNWLRDYLYIPLGGNRRGPRRTYINLMVVMLLGGLWHGAAWKFVLWGGMHGSALSAERFTRERGWRLPVPTAGKVLLTFVFICLAWVPFRAESMSEAVDYFGSMFGIHRGDVLGLLAAQVYTGEHLVTFSVAGLIAFFGIQTWDLARRINLWRSLAAMLLLAASMIATNGKAYHPFLYFQF